MAKSPFNTVAPMDHMVRTAPLYNGYDEAVIEPRPLAIEAADPRIAIYTPLFDEAIARDDRRQRLNLLARQLTMG